MRYHVGCSGWSYKHWRGNLYPSELPARRWLEHYASIFDTVEINGSFYRLPSEAAIRGWRDQAPPGFCYSAKVSRLVTHFLRLRNCETALCRFLDRIRLLGDRLGPLLYQLPPDFERDDARLEAFLALLPPDLVHVFEFRNRSWWNDEVWRLLRDHEAVFCAHHVGETATPMTLTSSVFYMRFHGPATAYASGYSDEALGRWAAKLRKLDVEEAWLYFNNDVGGHAHRDALRLRALLGAFASKAGGPRRGA